MTGYIIRRLLYGVLILVGVNLFTFVLFFAVNTPDDMARLAIGGQRVSVDAVEKWKIERGYDKPLFLNRVKSEVKSFAWARPGKRSCLENSTHQQSNAT